MPAKRRVNRDEEEPADASAVTVPKPTDADERKHAAQQARARGTAVADGAAADSDDSWEDEDDEVVDERFDEMDEGVVVQASDDDDDGDGVEHDEEYERLQQERKKVKFTTTGDAEAEDEDDDDGQPEKVGEVWRRDRGEKLQEGDELQYANRAYDCFFQMRSEFPCLSFDILRDGDGVGRTKYPLALSMVIGSQAADMKQNQLYVIRVRNLLRTKHDQDDDEESEEDVFGANDSETESDEGADGEEAVEEVNGGEPLIAFQTIRHHGAVNRVRSNPLQPSMVATWSDAGVVQVFDVAPEMSIVAEFSNAAREQNVSAEALARKGQPLKFTSPSNTHAAEGYGLGWSIAAPNTFASGDIDGRIFVWRPQAGGKWAAVGGTPASEGRFVEEIQWSPTQESVFIAARARGDMEVWDTRDLKKSKIAWRADPTDINVAAWNKATTSSHLVATGADSGIAAVWDLRMLSQKKRPDPIQSITFHQGHPITSISFSDHNESVLTMTSHDGQCTIWDLSVERDADEEREALGELYNRGDTTTLPDQLMFQHQGLVHPKEAHFHPQIPGLVLTGDFNGINLFKPRNWRSLMK